MTVGLARKKFDVVRLSIKDKEYLEERAGACGTDMAKYLRKLIAEDKRRVWFEEAREAESALRGDKQAWVQESKERNIWDATIEDYSQEA